MKTRTIRNARFASLALLVGSAAFGALGCRQILGIEDPVPCTSDDACNEADQPCITGECVDGACVFSQRAEGFVLDEAEVGDCKSHVCDANGASVVETVAGDAPVDDTPGDCLVPACDSNGDVVPAIADDPPPDDVQGDCMTLGCDNGMVKPREDPTDTPEADIPGDCHKPTCDGGAPEIDDTDVPTTSCDSCDNGVVTAWAEEGMPCYDGPAGTDMVGVCERGTWTCDASNLRVCDGEITPTQEQCGTGFSGFDEDCDGSADEDGPGCACTLGQSQACYTGPANTINVGTCKGGTSNCTATGMGNVFGPCGGEVVPKWDSCIGNTDEDCSGAAETCTGSAVFTKAFGLGNGQTMIELTDGSLIATGGFTGSITANNTITSDGANDVFIIHLDAAGNAIKAKALGGVGIDGGGQAVPSTNGFIVGVNLGETSSETFGGSVSYTPQGNDGFLTKYDPDLVHQWTVQIGGTGNENIIAMAPGPNGSVVVVGTFSSPTVTIGTATLTNQGAEEFYVARISATGVVSWVKNIGGANDDEVTSVAVNAAGEVYLAGSTNGPIAYAGSTIANAGSFDAWVVKLDSTGVPLWQRAIQSSGVDGWPEVAVQSSGDVWVTIASTSPLNVDGVAGNDLTPVGTGSDQMLMHYSASGAYLGGTVFNGSGSSSSFVRYHLLVGPYDSMVLTGWLDATQQFGSTTETTAGGNDASIVKLAPNGMPIWFHRYGGTGYDLFQQGSINANGDILVAGTFNKSGVSFGGGALPYVGTFGNVVFAKYHQ